MKTQGSVALYGGGGAPFHHAAVLAAAGHRVEFVFPVEILDGCLRAFDAFVMPGGGYQAMSGQITPLGHRGARAIRDFVQDGGLYLGSCAGSFDAATVPAGFVAACPAQAEMCLLAATIWNETTSSPEGLQSPGVGVLRVRNAQPEHPIMAGMPDSFPICHYNGPLFRGGEALTVVEGATRQFTPAEHFLGDTSAATLIEQAAAQQVANAVVGVHGRGRVVLFGSHPEFGFSTAMDDPQPAAKMLDNAVRWQLEQSGRARGGTVDLIARRADATGDLAGQVRRLTARIAERNAELRTRGLPRAAWLEPRYAMSTFGLRPDQIWQQGLESIARLAQEVDRRAPAVDRWVLAFHQPPDWSLDGGFHGVIALLEQTEAMLAQAAAAWDIELGAPVDDPYAFDLISPFHLVAGSYLAALGRIASAALLCRAFSAERT